MNKQLAAKRSPQDPLDAFFGGWPFSYDVSFPKEDQFVPKLDISETDKEIEVHVELAGIPKDNISIDLDDEVLTISGESKSRWEDKGDGKTWHRVESRSGKFMRKVRLPPGATSDQVSASTENGVLTITIQKPEPPKKKSSKIAISEKK